MTIHKKGARPLERGVLSVDCGVTGAICLMTNNTLKIESMPDRNKPELIMKLLYDFRELARKEFDGKYPLMMMEHVAGRKGDSPYAISKLIMNYGICWAYSDGLGMRPVIWKPNVWKSKAYMNVMVTKKDHPEVDKITVSMRKQKTVDLIKKIYPWLDFSVPQCDAVALAEFGKRILIGDILLKKKNSLEAQRMIHY